MGYLLDLCNNINNEQRTDHKLDHIENMLFQAGCKTNKKVLKKKIFFMNFLLKKIF